MPFNKNQIHDEILKKLDGGKLPTFDITESTRSAFDRQGNLSREAGIEGVNSSQALGKGYARRLYK